MSGSVELLSSEFSSDSRLATQSRNAMPGILPKSKLLRVLDESLS